MTNAGLAVTIGFVRRMTTQQMQLRAGYWLIVPLSAIHLAFAILSFFYWNTGWPSGVRFSCPEPRKQSFNPKHRVRIYPVVWVEELGMMSPWLPLTIVAQVFMGSSYVYSSKWSTDMNLFYSLGDSNVFLTLQVYCRNAEAIGGLLGTYLFTLNPIAPFAFSTGLTVLCLVLYTVDCRVG